MMFGYGKISVHPGYAVDMFVSHRQTDREKELVFV